MRIVFMGTPAFSVPTLQRLAHEGHDVVAAYTREPKPSGRRGLQILKSPVHQAAEALGIPVHTPSTLKEPKNQDQFRSFAADLAIVVAYGLILPKPVLEAPARGCFNLHASLLPRWRGAAPIQRAIMEGDAETGVDLMRMEEGLDTGPIGLQQAIPIRPQDTAGDLAPRLSEIAANLAAAGLEALNRASLIFRDQPPIGATYAQKITKSEAEIDWRRPAPDVRNQIHGLSPAPGAFSVLAIAGRTERIKIYRAETASGRGKPGEVLSDDMVVACADGSIRVLEAQRAGRTPVSGRDLMRSHSTSSAAFLVAHEA